MSSKTCLNIIINKSSTKFWMDIYSKPADSKPYVPFISNHPRHCLTTTPFSLGRRIYTIVENRNVKKKALSRSKKKTLLEQKQTLSC